MSGTPAVSVLMPVYNGTRWIARAIASLIAQSFQNWELIVVDDGSTDGTAEIVRLYENDGRMRLERLPENRGMGAALNHALDLAVAPLIAYLPADDVYYRDHLATLIATLDEHRDAVVVYSGVRHHYNRTAEGQIDGEPLQLVQVMHRREADRWLARNSWEWETDDLDRMYWNRLRAYGGRSVGTGQVTCEWVDHPDQRHKILREPVGGLNTYRDHYRVQTPIRMHTTMGNRIDEEAHYRRFRERPDTPPAADGLKILIVGELAYNSERILALEERGHRLYGLWMPRPYWYNTVGPLPFGHVQDIPREGWREAVRALQPDIIWAGLNWQAVPFAHEVLRDNPGVPFVWHFKEGPFICLEKGSWEQLVDLYTRSDGQIYCSPEMRDWFATVLPTGVEHAPSLVLDGDLPKREWLEGEPSSRLSDADGEIHTVVPGRPIGLHPYTVAELAAEGVHLHFYGDFTHGQWRAWIDKTRGMAPHHLHLHANVDQGEWVREFSRYDAGWLHFFDSENGGDIRRANWDDLNIPARLATLAVAGLPVLQHDNSGAIVATQTLARDLDIGVFFRDMAELGEKLRDHAEIERLRANMQCVREQFTFDHHADRLIAFFREVIAVRG